MQDLCTAGLGHGCPTRGALGDHVFYKTPRTSKVRNRNNIETKPKSKHVRKITKKESQVAKLAPRKGGVVRPSPNMGCGAVALLYPTTVGASRKEGGDRGATTAH